ncbi:hypothetical protein PoB_004407600 [Plakobranchus ocellatus]|uniref:Uncharacterized protein n=1 Tax=Plakobranchus ocellatus TaxID=259542 RepID=A0AAV4BAY1_9GAST|nr:hypothetical protein PoB_004407600 [Plakobranchus ocellatus]
MYKDLEPKPSRRLWRLVKERPMLKLHRQKLMLRDSAVQFPCLGPPVSTFLQLSNSSVSVNHKLHFCRNLLPLSRFITIYSSAVIHFLCLSLSRSTFLQWSNFGPILKSRFITINISAMVHFLCLGSSRSTFMQWSNSSVIDRKDLHFCSGPIRLSRFITIPVDKDLCHHVERSRINTKQMAQETGERKTHAESLQAELMLRDKAEPFLKPVKNFKKSRRITWCPVDEALCHHVQGSRTKAKQKALETRKRKTHAEIPQAEADVERLSKSPLPISWYISIYISALVHFNCLGTSRSTILQWSTSTLVVHLDIPFYSDPLPLSWYISIYLSTVVHFNCLGASRSIFLQ